MALADAPDFLTMEEAAEILRIGRNQAYEQARVWRAANGELLGSGQVSCCRGGVVLNTQVDPTPIDAASGVLHGDARPSRRHNPRVLGRGRPDSEVINPTVMVSG